jgi:hypothetical protein
MAYGEVDMCEILEVLRRFHRRESKAAIQRATGRTRKTGRRYVEKARELGWDGEAEPDEALAVAVARRRKPVPDEPRARTSEAALTPHRERIRQWLSPEDSGRGLRLSKVHVLLGVAWCPPSSTLVTGHAKWAESGGPGQLRRTRGAAPA